MPKFSRTAQTAMARIAHQAWTVSRDAGSALSRHGRSDGCTRMLHRYLTRCSSPASVDEKIANTFLSVLNMLSGPADLQRLADHAEGDPSRPTSSATQTTSPKRVTWPRTYANRTPGDLKPRAESVSVKRGSRAAGTST